MPKIAYNLTFQSTSKYMTYLDHIAILVIMFSYQIVEKLLKVVELVSMSNVAINLLLLMK